VKDDKLPQAVRQQTEGWPITSMLLIAVMSGAYEIVGSCLRASNALEYAWSAEDARVKEGESRGHVRAVVASSETNITG